MANFKLTTAVQAMIDMGVLTGEAHKVTVDTLRQDAKLGKQWKKLADTYRATGITAAMIATEKQGGIPELRGAVRQTCIDALPDAERALLDKDIEVVEPERKEERRDIQKTVGRNLNKIEAHLKAAEAEKTKTPSVSRNKRELITNLIDKVIGYLTGDDDGSLVGLDLPKLTKDARAIRTNLM